MIDTSSIAVAIGSIRPVISMTGNAGRSVRRAIEHTFATYGDGRARGNVRVRSDIGGLAFAFLAMEVRRAAGFSTVAATEAGQPGLKFALSKVDLSNLCIVVEMTVDAIPESMTARQAFLEVVVAELMSMAEYLERIPQTVEKMLFQLFSEGSTLAAVRSQRYLQQFHSLVGGDFSDIANTPCVLLDMAKDLNPGVRAAEAALDAKFAAEEEHMVTHGMC